MMQLKYLMGPRNPDSWPLHPSQAGSVSSCIAGSAFLLSNLHATPQVIPEFPGAILNLFKIIMLLLDLKKGIR